jgi:hypothetical protein
MKKLLFLLTLSFTTFLTLASDNSEIQEKTLSALLAQSKRIDVNRDPVNPTDSEGKLSSYLAKRLLGSVSIDNTCKYDSNDELFNCVLIIKDNSGESRETISYQVEVLEGNVEVMHSNVEAVTAG